jgi:hypothetical protein
LCPVGITGSAYILRMDIYLPLTTKRSNMLLNLVSGIPLTHQARVSMRKRAHLKRVTAISVPRYMPALSAKQHDPHIRAYFLHLVANGKKPLQAVCAVMRKLLHAIHGMLKHDQPFDNTRFYAIPKVAD